MIKKIIIFCFFSTMAQAQEPSITSGLATKTHDNLIDCGPRSRITAVGTITSTDGKEWAVPADTAFLTADKATDLYNECGGTELGSVAELDLSAVPLYDVGGDEEFVAYIFGDNYFEFYVNGKLLAVDPVTFTPFNANVIRFKATRPMTVAVKMVDWEEHLGIGAEVSGSRTYHAGDGGLVMHIKDMEGNTVSITDESWKAETFYTAPLSDLSCLNVTANSRDSSGCSYTAVEDGSILSAAHWDVPNNWASPDFDASHWPNAHLFTNETVVVHNKRGYTNFTDLFDDPSADAQFIWSSNLILDNLVLIRTTIE